MNLHHSIINQEDLPENQRFIDWFELLHKELHGSHQRCLLLLQGERGWCVRQLSVLTAFDQRVILSDQADIASARPFSTAERLLGVEADCVVYDQFSGLNIDVMCMAVGLIRAGGLLVVLAPQQQQEGQDPYGSWQGIHSPHAYFRQYLQRFYQSSDAVLRYRQGHELPRISPLPQAVLTALPQGLSRGQQRLLKQMKQWFRISERRMFLVTADRGRGKSTLLGHFVRSIQGNAQIQVVAASRAQAEVLLGSLDPAQADAFLAPDEMIRRQQPVDCLVIDEAAMLPYSLLQQCMALANKLVMATTTGGYEGTGQGFLLKFLARLKKDDFVHGQLHGPIRWARGDQLERLFNRMLLLKCEVNAHPDPAASRVIREITHQQLSQDNALLKAVYGLLISAHYRTRPSDLRQLMENENQRLLVAMQQGEVIAVLQLNLEGGFEEGLCEQVFLGKRRPQGHLFAQMLTAQAGLRRFATYRGYRIQRITVHQSMRRLGIGRLLVQQACQRVHNDGLDYLASSFALDADTVLFWQRLGFHLVHIGSGKGKSTGQQTIAVITTAKPALQQQVAILRERVKSNLPVWLLTYCNNLPWREVRALLSVLKYDGALNALEQDEIFAFAEGHRGFDLSQATLQKLLMISLGGEPPLTAQQQQLMIEKVLLNRAWQRLGAGSTDTGRKAQTRAIRQSIKICYEYICAKP